MIIAVLWVNGGGRNLKFPPEGKRNVVFMVSDGRARQPSLLRSERGKNGEQSCGNLTRFAMCRNGPNVACSYAIVSPIY